MVVGQIAGDVVDGPQFICRRIPRRQHHGHRHRLLALPEVVASRLAGHRRITPNAKQVVHRLESQPQLPSEGLQCIHLVVRRPGQHRAHRRRIAQQRSGLVGLHGQTSCQIYLGQIVEGHVGGLAGDHRRGGRHQPGRGPDPLLSRRRIRNIEQHLEGQVVEGVPGDNGVVHPESRPHRRTVSALQVAVDDVVVNQ